MKMIHLISIIYRRIIVANCSLWLPLYVVEGIQNCTILRNLFYVDKICMLMSFICSRSRLYVFKSPLEHCRFFMTKNTSTIEIYADEKFILS